MPPLPTLNRRAVLGLAAGCTLPLAWPALAESYPSRALHIVVPFTPGGSNDFLAHALGAALARSLGQQVVIDNVPGSGGVFGAERVARMPADGYTLLMGHVGTLAIAPALYPNLAYDPLSSFVPIGLVARVPNLLAVKSSLPARSLKDLVELAKSRPGRIAYGSPGSGSTAQATMEMLKLQTGAPMLHIPYRGSADSVKELLSDGVQVVFTGTPGLMALIRMGKVRALAVGSTKRLPLLPNVPTIAESLPATREFETDQWYGLLAPAGTPGDIIALLNEHLNKALASEALLTDFADRAVEATPGSPQALTQQIAREVPRWQKVVKTTRIRPE
ncbi:tripartite tricarboxylate transporter substrate binding protein [Ramlibacter monticola]|uniref:Tripartite tricarboxylate transporter substrate binding protein n=1 Tax=Ramlibacter monticola TaxID=1926872 RepID=A0A936Z081_9BURK|nr:tripartite tricarboxylate transporter substrate-binding protein [Ramlibacter monticola]MBL0391679.1 tripartite tricarboxylate transporter substrate binding protein [Ramlibacter monticola]